ncbi:MAG: alpha-hydroxy-acid oxidizing protein [Actinobacteria bacterium]|nr:alpha-hydroxy-acid oxidizing protein [Actinomycetota bacterium]MBO0835436.1 alpha-hydroxy-acid oxidizing protein [Actinomycetota bacterium]
MGRFQRARLAKVLNYQDARRLAKRTLPRAVFDYVDGGAEDEVTLRRNSQSFQDLCFRPRMGVWVPEPDLSTSLFGQPVSFPVLAAPCGAMRLVHPEADIAVARASAAAGTIHVASSASGFSLEEIAESSPDRHWFQLYRYRGRAGMENLVHRAKAAGYKAIVATVDTPLVSKRERDWRNGFSFSMRVNAANALRLGPQLAPRPFWLARYILDGLPFQLANTAGMTEDGAPMALPEMGHRESSSPTWDDIAWVRQNFDGPVLVKGVLTGEDARKALDLGCDGIVVSNHGGRQLEGAPASIDVLPEIVAAVGDKLEILVDGGVRRGGDVIKALALGAKAVLVGRMYVWGLALAGQDGVSHMLDILRAEMMRSMQLMGCPSIRDLDHTWVTHARAEPGSRV